ncbi:MAG: acetyl-CoA C-acetyltransferase [Planctomycetales bacterium]
MGASMTSAYILSGCRTPIGKFLGSLCLVSATDLGGLAVAEAIRRSGVSPAAVDQVIMGNVLSAGLGQAPARQAALKAGIPPTVAALTINKVCGSGLKAVMLADQAIRLAEADVVVAGGMENMSQAPHLLTNVRAGWKLGERSAIDSMVNDGLWCSFEDHHMGVSADYIADQQQVSRADQDAYAVESHKRAITAVDQGKFAEEIISVTVAGRKGDSIVEFDEGPRADTSSAALEKLRPSFGSQGSVTAGNASQLSDGAAAVVVASETLALNTDSSIKARIVASATSGVEPKEIFIAPVKAIQKVLDKASLAVEDIDLFELNEAFAAQSLACVRPLNLDPTKVNVNGGSIALGHPIGASGARILVTLLHALADRNLRRGLASLCLGGGNAVAMIVERV